jgi:hypothetical protein
MNSRLILSILAYAIFLFSCNRSDKEITAQDSVVANTENATGSSNKNEEEQNQIPVQKIKQPFADSTSTKMTVQSNASIDWDKKIIKTATLKFEIKDFKNYTSTVYKTVKQYGGYIAQEEQNLTDEKLETTISIKVPVDQFENIMNQLPAGDAKVIERKITTDDVTGEVIDIKARLEAKKQMREKYLDFLKQSKNMQEVLQVQAEINNLQEGMESAAGRVNFLNHQSAMSTIQLTFFQPLEGFKPDVSNPTFITRITDAFKSGGRWITDILIGLVTLWPLLIFIPLGILLFRKIFPNKIKQPVS